MRVKVKLIADHGNKKAGDSHECHVNLVPVLHAEGKISDAELKKHVKSEESKEPKEPAKK